MGIGLYALIDIAFSFISNPAQTSTEDWTMAYVQMSWVSANASDEVIDALFLIQAEVGFIIIFLF